jgi:hypothetical protein
MIGYGMGIIGSKYNRDLTITDIAKEIRKDLKVFKDTYKFSVKVTRYTGGRNISVTIKDCVKDEIYKTCWDELDNKQRVFILDKLGEDWFKNKTVQELDNMAKLQSMYNRFYNQSMLDDIAKIDSIVNAYNYDDSDTQTDYFDVNFYYLGCEVDLKKCLV